MKPRRKFIFVCNGKDCKKNDASTFTKEIKQTIGAGEFKGHYKLVKSKCMGCCKSGPVAVVGHHLIKRGDINHLVAVLQNKPF